MNRPRGTRSRHAQCEVTERARRLWDGRRGPGSIKTNTMYPELRFRFLKGTARAAHDKNRDTILAVPQVRHLRGNERIRVPGVLPQNKGMDVRPVLALVVHVIGCELVCSMLDLAAP